MGEVIKGSSPFNQIVVDGDVKVGVPKRRKKIDPEQSDGEESDYLDDEGGAGSSGSSGSDDDSEMITISKEELASIRAQYRMDGEQYAEEMRMKTSIEFSRAKSQADKLVEDAENKSHEILAKAEDRVAVAEAEGRKQGFEQGYAEGHEKGSSDGYSKGLAECRAALLDLQSLCQRIKKEKTELMAENRRAIFDLSMGIAQKITMTVLSQKDKSVLQKMITNAAKDFRKAKTVKVTLSRLDLSDNVETDLQTFEKCFSPTTQVEFELLEDGERGTLQIETDSEILDAGVSTQLKMIEELGSGKYRDKEVERPAEKPADKPQETSVSDTMQNVSVPVQDGELIKEDEDTE